MILNISQREMRDLLKIIYMMYTIYTICDLDDLYDLYDLCDLDDLYDLCDLDRQPSDVCQLPDVALPRIPPDFNGIIDELRDENLQVGGSLRGYGSHRVRKGKSERTMRASKLSTFTPRLLTSLLTRKTPGKFKQKSTALTLPTGHGWPM